MSGHDGHGKDRRSRRSTTRAMSPTTRATWAIVVALSHPIVERFRQGEAREVALFPQSRHPRPPRVAVDRCDTRASLQRCDAPAARLLVRGPIGLDQSYESPRGAPGEDARTEEAPGGRPRSRLPAAFRARPPTCQVGPDPHRTRDQREEMRTARRLVGGGSPRRWPLPLDRPVRTMRQGGG